MKTLTVQIQQGLTSAPEAESAVRQLLALAGEVQPARKAEAVPGEGIINVNFRTPDVSSLWRAIQERLGLLQGARPPIGAALIVVCEGDYGWDDYLLLHHFDEYETPDHLPL